MWKKTILTNFFEKNYVANWFLVLYFYYCILNV